MLYKGKNENAYKESANENNENQKNVFLLMSQGSLYTLINVTLQ